MEQFMNSKIQLTNEQVQKVQELRLMVEKCQELQIGTEDILLTKFLHFADWSTVKALLAIQRYYDFKFRNPSWMAQHSVEYFREQFFFTLSKFVMPKPDNHGRAVVLFKTVDAFKKFPDYLMNVMQLDDLIIESLLLLPQVQKCGITLIYDLTGTTRNFLRLLSPTFMRLLNEKDQVVPIKSRVVHVIQRGFLLYAASTLLLPFVSKEFKDNVITHDGKNFDKLREMVGYKSLPAQYGGPPENQLDANLLYNHLLKNACYLKKLQSYNLKCALTNKMDKN